MFETLIRPHDVRKTVVLTLDELLEKRRLIREKREAEAKLRQERAAQEIRDADQAEQVEQVYDAAEDNSMQDTDEPACKKVKLDAIAEEETTEVTDDTQEEITENNANRKTPIIASSITPHVRGHTSFLTFATLPPQLTPEQQKRLA